MSTAVAAAAAADDASSISSAESTKSLTEPTLNSIYDSRELLDENNKNNDIYNHLQEDIATLTTKESNEAAQYRRQQRRFREKKKGTTLALALGKLFVLGISGILFVTLCENIHDNNVLLTSHVVYRPFIISTKIVNYLVASGQKTETASSTLCTSTFVRFVWGVLLGSIQPILDSVFPSFFTSKLFNFSPKGSSQIVDFSSIVRSTIVLLGISFGLRRVDWESTLQASIAFSLLDPCVWLLLDSTISGFIGCFVFSIVATGFVILFDDSNDIDQLKALFNGTFFNSENMALHLFTASFFFCALIIYGKLGRFLFRE